MMLKAYEIYPLEFDFNIKEIESKLKGEKEDRVPTLKEFQEKMAQIMSKNRFWFI